MSLAAVFFVAMLVASTLPSSAAEPVKKWQLPAMEFPADNPPSDDKIALGKQLFFDTRLSRTDRVACASCHQPAKGWSDGRQLAVGIEARRGQRNTPTIINAAFNQHLFWDGRASSLEDQALGPIENPLEMDLRAKDLAAKLNRIDGYRRQFRDVFSEDATPATIAKALAAFQRTIVSDDLPVDRFFRGEDEALSPSARRGMELFFGEANCSVCHSGPNFTDQKFHNIGVGIDSRERDLGRASVTHRAEDRYAFKTPTLREVAHTSPYMHDGSFASLEQVVRHYNFGGVTDADNPGLDESLQVLYLAEDQASDLVVFLRDGLSSRRLKPTSTPKLPK